MDPFLRLVHESKLQVVKDYLEDPSKSYGSTEDNKNALRSLSAVELTGTNSRESMVSTIINSIAYIPDVIFYQLYISIPTSPELNSVQCLDELPLQILQAELEDIRSQLLTDFSPDDMCPTSAQFFESPGKNSESRPGDDADYQEVYTYDILPIFSPSFFFPF
jgi:hypothetical protein